MAQDQLPPGFTAVEDELPPGFTAVPDFSTTNAKTATGEAEVDPNTLGTAARHLWQTGNPLIAAKTIGQALIPERAARLLSQADQYVFGSDPMSDQAASQYGPLNTIKNIGAAQMVPYQKAVESYQKGDYLTAGRHFVDYLIPLVGPALDRSADLFQAGKWAAGGGEALGLGLSMYGPEALANSGALAKVKAQVGPLFKNAVPENAAASAAGIAAGVPVDVATATGHPYLRNVQKVADESLLGSFVGPGERVAQQEGMARWGGQLADQVLGQSLTPEQAGRGVRAALQAKAAGHGALANQSYNALREMEADPANRMGMPGPQVPVDAVKPEITAQLRRVVHELDASGYHTGKLLEDEPGISSGTTYNRGSAGAAVYNDILDNLSSGSRPTRGAVQTDLEQYLAGGPETASVRAALEVAKGRFKGVRDLSRPELPPSAMSVPTRLEAGRQTTQDMGLPVDVTKAKVALQPVYDQLKRQLTVTQKASNPGWTAIQNIMDGPDYGPLSQIDRDLSAIKKIARQQGGVGKLAVGALEQAVQDAAAAGGPDVTATRNIGRGAVKAGAVTKELLKKLPGQKMQEPGPVFDALTSASDNDIELLRAVAEQQPAVVPQLARAKLEQLMAMKPDKAAAEWGKLGPETKARLYPNLQPTIDQFFRLNQLLAENPNRSGSGLVALKGGEGALLYANPLLGGTVSIGAAVLSKLLHNPATAKALTQSMQLSLGQVPAIAQRASMVKLMQAAQAAGISLDANREDQ